MTRIKIHISNVKLPFYPPCEVKCRLQNRVSTPQQKREELVEFLKQNIDVFAWNAYEAPGVDPEFICNHLNVNPLIAPKKQPPRRPSKEHAEVVQEKVARLKQAKAIKEVFYLV